MEHNDNNNNDNKKPDCHEWKDNWVHLIGSNLSKTACCDLPANSVRVTLQPKRVTCPKYWRQ